MRRRYSPIHYENSGLFTITIALPPPPSGPFQIAIITTIAIFFYRKSKRGRGNRTMEAKETIDGSGK
jgi:hypothetical protein